MNRIKLLLIIVIAMGIFSSCEDEERGPVIGTFDSPQILGPTGSLSYVLTEEIENNVMATFTWTDADFGFAAEVTYTLQIDEAGNEFADAMDVGSTLTDTLKVNVGSLNNLLLSAGYPFNVAGNFEARIMAVVSPDVDPLYSEVISMTITPFEKIVIYPMLYVPGSYQGWAPDAAPNLYSLKSNNKYEGYVYFSGADNEFKFTDAPDWNNGVWGDADASGTTGTIDQGGQGNNIKVAIAGYYKINVDLNEFTYTTLATTWGLIGDATPDGWDNDQPMTYDAANNVWTITVDLIAGAIKFRANSGWDLNYGSNNANGICDAGGDNIPVADAGNYTVTLDLSGPLYRYTLTKN